MLKELQSRLGARPVQLMVINTSLAPVPTVYGQPEMLMIIKSIQEGDALFQGVGAPPPEPGGPPVALPKELEQFLQVRVIDARREPVPQEYQKAYQSWLKAAGDV